jgi:glycosyltransferase involved in cell wall biosynthesis
MFLSPEEQRLAVQRLGVHPRHAGIVGGGLAVTNAQGRSSAATPHDLLYVGRLESGKNLGLLYEHVRRYADNGGNLRLVVLGQGHWPPPAHPAFEHQGFVSEEAKASAYATALALCQPSLKESFSLTIMESWLAARPVLVHGDCAVTRGHVERSKGGLWFRTFEEFVGAVEWLQANSALADRMGQNGRQYVLSNYTWESVATRFERLIRQWQAQDG